MADIRLITILPPPQISGITQPQPTQSGSPGILVNVPTGSVLSGYIVNRDASGNPILRTEKADIVFSSNFFLKIGSEVVIRVENRAGQQHAHILSVNGQSPEVAENQSAFAQEPEVIIGQNQPAPQRSTVVPALDTIVSRAPIATSVTGTVIPQPATAGREVISTLTAGTQLTLRIISIAAPAESTTPTASPPALANTNASVSPNQPTSTAYAAYVRTGAPLPTAASTFNAPPVITDGLPAATTSGSPTPVANTPPLPRIGETIAATVLSNDPAGEALIQTPAGIIRLEPGAVLPPGSKVVFEITQLLAPNQAIPTDELAPAPLTELARSWSSLQQIVSFITAHNIASDALQLQLPALLTPNPANPQATPAPQNITAGLLVFVSALRGGEFRNWLGKDTVDWLTRNGHEALVHKAEGEFLSMARPLIEQPAQSWQTLFFPFVANGEVQQVRLFVKRDKKKEKSAAGKQEDDTRFVVEVDLTQLGELQMDGFVRRREQSVEFNLIIRSLLALDPAVRDDILAIYNNVGELTGYKGGIQFQTVKEFPIRPMEELAAEHINNLIV